MLPPVIWLGLMRTAKNDGAFAPIDIGSLDVFPMHLCSCMGSINLQIPKESPCVSFETAVQDRFPEEFSNNMLDMLSAFDKLPDKTLFPTTFTFILASVRYLLHRISLSTSLDTDTQSTFGTVLHRLENHAKLNDLPHEQIAALSDLLEHAIIHSSVFKLGSNWTPPQMFLVSVYSAMVGASSSHGPGCSPRHNSWPALRPLVEFLIHQYDAPYDDWFAHTLLDTICQV
ncbi:hypothetical protein IW261DRAFT_426670 [Armillaria novae-zelandiae]|uniref:Uncharacterized protein n=1 Tax=Armillaria novae-zelandiae TaxID=153914 RepID=A0AA39KH42_9AGAR|nr:hypothetical protein IW261DRAFT_426670 [Armillaria novae-zelandiae]